MKNIKLYEEFLNSVSSKELYLESILILEQWENEFDTLNEGEKWEKIKDKLRKGTVSVALMAALISGFGNTVQAADKIKDLQDEYGVEMVDQAQQMAEDQSDDNTEPGDYQVLSDDEIKSTIGEGTSPDWSIAKKIATSNANQNYANVLNAGENHQTQLKGVGEIDIVTYRSPSGEYTVYIIVGTYEESENFQRVFNDFKSDLEADNTSDNTDDNIDNEKDGKGLKKFAKGLNNIKDKVGDNISKIGDRK